MCKVKNILLNWYNISHKHLHPIYFKHANIAELADFIRVQQFHAPGAFVEVIAKRNASVPALDFTTARPELDVYWVGRLDHTFEGGDVN